MPFHCDIMIFLLIIDLDMVMYYSFKAMVTQWVKDWPAKLVSGFNSHMTGESFQQ